MRVRFNAYILADWLYDASLTNMVSQEIYTTLSTYLDTIPTIGKYHRNIVIIKYIIKLYVLKTTIWKDFINYN